MARLNELWRSVNGPGIPPDVDAKRVKARVNAALDADQAERKSYMSQKLRTALLIAAATAALTGSAFAAATGWTGLSSWFQGDPAPVQEYVDSTVREVSDENYTLTVEGMAADENSAYLTVAVTALSGQAREFLDSEDFIGMDLFSITPVCRDVQTGEDSLPMAYGGVASHELERQTQNARRFALSMDDLPDSTVALRVRCGYMEKGKLIEAPLTPVPAKTVKIGDSGIGILSLSPDTLPEPETITIDEIVISPLTVRVKGSLSYSTEPNLRLRMSDGTIRTQSQLMDGTSWGDREANYRMKEVLDLKDVRSVIVFDKEYPLDGSKPTPVEHDDSLDPITVARMERLDERSGYTLPVRELTEKLGGTCVWDSVTGDVACTYRGVSIVLHAGRNTAQVGGEEVELRCTPAEQNGVLAADCRVFFDAWGLDGFVQRESIRNEKDPTNPTILWGDWYIVP